MMGFARKPLVLLLRWQVSAALADIARWCLACLAQAVPHMFFHVSSSLHASSAEFVSLEDICEDMPLYAPGLVSRDGI